MVLRFNYHYLIIISLVAFNSCGNDAQNVKQSSAVLVTTETIIPKTIPAIFSFVGFTQSSHEVEIRARVEGYLEKVSYKEGSFVKSGQVLYQLDKKPFEASLENARGYLSKQKAILWNAQKTLERLKPLFEENAASRKDLDSATADELTAKAEVQSAKAKLMQAELDLSYTTIKSPISGLIADTNYKQGALITPGTGGLLTTVAVVDPIWVYFSISENERLKFKKEQDNQKIIIPKHGELEVEIVLADGSIYPYKGNINFASPTIDQKTGTMSVRASIPNPDNVLMPGQFVKIHVLGVTRPNAILVPQKAVLEGKSGSFVYVMIDEKAEIRNVELGEWYEDQWIINSGLIKGDVVVIDGVNKIQASTPLKILDSPTK